MYLPLTCSGGNCCSCSGRCGGGTKKPPWPVGGQREITPAGFRVKSTFAMKCWVDHHGNASVRRGHDAPLLTNDDDTTDDHRKHHC